MNEPQTSRDAAWLGLRKARGSRISLRRSGWHLAPRSPPRNPSATAGEQRVAGLTACKVSAPPAGPGRAGPARLTCGQALGRR